MTRNFINAIFISCISFLFFANCNSSKNQEEANQNASLYDSLNSGYLTIVDDSVHVYSEQGGNHIVMKLNTGTRCKIISKGNFEIRDSFDDFWYCINYEDKKGWVFGAKTSLRKKSEFDIFLRVFSNAVKEPLSDKYSKNFLNGHPRFIPMEYKRLSNNRYASLFSRQTKFEVEILLMIYKSGIPAKDYLLFSGNIKDCVAPQAFFTSKDFVKLIWPSCKASVASIMYYQILEDNRIRELKSTITAKTVDEILPKIKTEQNIVNKSLSDECKCIVHSSVKIGYSAKNVVFYSILRDECNNFCNSDNYSLIAMPDSSGWSIKFEEKGIFHAMYESGIPNIFIVDLEEIRQKHLYEKISIERVFLLDINKQTMQELNLRSESCVILSPDHYGCNFCVKNTTHHEELIFRGNPIEQVLKKITNIFYDENDACKVIGQNSDQIYYDWDASKNSFEMQ